MTTNTARKKLEGKWSPCGLTGWRAFLHTRIARPCLAIALGVVVDASAQSLSIRPFGPTNQVDYGDRPISGFNSRTEMVGGYWEPFNDARGYQYYPAWVWLLNGGHGLPTGYTSVPPPYDATIGDRWMRFVGIDENSRITMNLEGDGLIGSTNAGNPLLPPGAWLGSVLRWDGPDSYQFIAGYTPRSAEPMIGDIWTRYARADTSGGAGIAVGQVHYVVITNLAYCTMCNPPRVSSVATTEERRRHALFDIANGGYRLMEPAGATITFYSISRLGNYICGLYQKPNDITRAGIWDWTGNVREFAPPDALPGMIPWIANERGEIAGTFNTNGHTWYSSNNTVGVFLYLPQAAYGLPAGVNIITNGAVSCQVPSINDRGQFLFSHQPTETNNFQYLWTRGRHQTLQSLMPSTTTWSNLWGVALNERGGMVGYGEGPYGYANFLARPWIDLDISTSTNRLRPGEELLVHVNITNRLSSELHSLNMLGALGLTPSNLARVVAGPEPAPPMTLPGGGGGRFTFRVLATNNGALTFTAQVRGTNGASTRYTSFIAQSEPVVIADAADLQVKLAAEPESTFVLNDGYFSYPSDLQLVTAQVQTNKPGAFDVRVENDSSVARTLRLTGTLTGSTNWSNSITLGDQDVTAQVLGAGGLTLADIEGEGRRELRVRMALKPAATSQEEQRLRLSLYSDSVPGAVMDLAELRGLRTSIPVTTYLARLTRNGLTPESIEAGLTDIDAPLIPVANTFLLGDQPLVSAGVVADGVTPLLIALNADREKLAGIQDGRRYRIELNVLEGTLAGALPVERLRTLSGSSWISSNVVVLTGDQPEGYAYLPGIPADDVTVSVATKEVKVSLKIIEMDTGLEVGSKVFAIRQPPLFLIHGYNTKGDWGADVISELSRTRENGTFLQVVRYGQNLYHDANLLSSVAGSDMENTYYTLRDLSGHALLAFNYARRKLEPFWAFTRHDVAAHSQGGLLTRMLASETVNPWMPQPYRNRENFNRGRFHRVVTIGSPHNGTRLLRYLLSLNDTEFSKLRNNLPVLIGHVGVLSEVAQDKFDPFGMQIRDLNDPSPNALWRPDPGARFHLVRATINNGLPPTALSATPSEVFLGLVHPDQPVVPDGSDGVVDWHSMAAQPFDGPAPVNSFTMSPSLLISHSGPLPLFATPAGETDSFEVAEHVQAALTQDPALPPSQRQFGPFPVPPLLPASIRDAIDAWATNVAILNFLTNPASGPQPASLPGGQTLLVTLDLPPGLSLTQPPGWFAEVYGTNGLTTDGVSIEVLSNTLNQARVTIDAAVVGDVVLKCGFRGADGVQYIARAQRLLRREAPDQSLTALSVEFGNTQLPVGTTVPLILVGTYSNGQSRLLFPLTNEVTAISDNPAVVTTANPLRWRIAGVGTALVTVQHAGLSTTVPITGFLRDQPYRVPLTIAQSGTNQVALSWPSTAPGVLEQTRSLGSTNWSPVASQGVVTGLLRQVTLPRTNATEFFRVQP